MSLYTAPGSFVVAPAPPSPAEIAVPFRFANGALATLDSEIALAIQHMLTIAFTMPGERVMRPTYGAGLQALVFEDSAPSVFTAAAKTLQDQYQATQTSFTTMSVSAEQYFSTWVFNVAFTLAQDTTVHNAVFDYAGNLVGAT